MFYYDRIDLLKETDDTKSNDRKKCIACHYVFSATAF